MRKVCAGFAGSLLLTSSGNGLDGMNGRAGPCRVVNCVVEVLDEWAIHAGLPRGEELVDEVQILDVEQVYPVPESGQKMPSQPPVDLREIGDPPELVIELAGVVERRHPRQFHLLCPLVEASKDDGAGRVLALEACRQPSSSLTRVSRWVIPQSWP